MASTKASNNRVGWKYTADNAAEYAVSAKAVYVLDGTDGSKYGGEAVEAADKVKPKQLRMRAVRCTATGKADRWIPAYTTTALIWTTPGTTITLNCLGEDVVFTATADKRTEHYGHAVRDTA